MTILIKKGILTDGVSEMGAAKDILIEDGYIAEKGAEISQSADYTIDADGCLVLPGLIDFHTHVFEGGSDFGFNPDLVLSTGVTALVDMGASGSGNFEAFHRAVSARTMETAAFLNISAMGQMGTGLNENLDPCLVNEGRIEELFQENPDFLLGIKVRISKAIAGKWGTEPLKKALEMGERLEKPVCVHVTDPCVDMDEVAAMLRKGDILCHMYHGKGSTILKEGRVSQAVWEARRRGVIFDAANGRTNFDFSVAEPAIKEGFVPHIISTDMTKATVNQGSLVRNLPYIMSKYLSLGMGLPEIVKAASYTPAVCMGRADRLGSLEIGKEGSITIVKRKSGDFIFSDAAGNKRHGGEMLIPLMTIRRGLVLFDNNELDRE